MHKVRRMVATLREIFMNGSSVKLSVSESTIARALNCVPRISCDLQAFLKKNTLEVRFFFSRSNVNRNVLEVFQ